MPDNQRRPVVSTDDLNALDTTEILEGYWDGREGFPCSGNRSRSYWHGWQNGMVDYGRMKGTTAQMLLAQDIVRRPNGITR